MNSLRFSSDLRNFEEKKKVNERLKKSLSLQKGKNQNLQKNIPLISEIASALHKNSATLNISKIRKSNEILNIKYTSIASCLNFFTGSGAIKQ